MTQVWFFDLDAAAAALEQSEASVPRLSADEGARIEAVAGTAERRRRRSAYIAQRLVLENLFGPGLRGQTLPRDHHGRPYLPVGVPGSVSLAHTENVALVAASNGPRIGADVEMQRIVRMSPVRRALIQSAAQRLSKEPLSAMQDRGFLQAWTRLEALAKADGQGIGHLLTRIGAVGGKPYDLDAAATIAASHGLYIHDLDLGPTLFASLATGNAGKPAIHRGEAGLHKKLDFKD